MVAWRLVKQTENGTPKSALSILRFDLDWGGTKKSSAPFLLNLFRYLRTKALLTPRKAQIVRPGIFLRLARATMARLRSDRGPSRRCLSNMERSAIRRNRGGERRHLSFSAARAASIRYPTGAVLAARSGRRHSGTCGFANEWSKLSRRKCWWVASRQAPDEVERARFWETNDQVIRSGP